MDEPPLIVASPCVRNCCLDHDDVCLGCFRTLDEILAWGRSDGPARNGILASASQRAADRVPQRPAWR